MKLRVIKNPKNKKLLEIVTKFIFEAEKNGREPNIKCKAYSFDATIKSTNTMVEAFKEFKFTLHGPSDITWMAYDSRKQVEMDFFYPRKEIKKEVSF